MPFVLANVGANALKAVSAQLVVLANFAATALQAGPALPVVLANVGATALLALCFLPHVRANAGATALLARSFLPHVRAQAAAAAPQLAPAAPRPVHTFRHFPMIFFPAAFFVLGSKKTCGVLAETCSGRAHRSWHEKKGYRSGEPRPGYNRSGVARLVVTPVVAWPRARVGAAEAELGALRLSLRYSLRSSRAPRASAPLRSSLHARARLQASSTRRCGWCASCSSPRCALRSRWTQSCTATASAPPPSP